MPLFRFVCIECALKAARFLSPTEARLPLPCTQCAGKMKRDVQVPSMQVVERLDNGLMPRAVERLADAERLFKDRAKGDRGHKE